MYPATYNLVQLGIQSIQKEHQEQEQKKVGILRAGNTGLLLHDSKGPYVVGKCARQTYLRFVGIEAGEDDASREFMFAAGRTNEDSWIDLLTRAGIQKDLIRKEEEVPISWVTRTGVPVTGRPDIVLGELRAGSWVPTRGLELKLVSSLWTARDVAIQESPKAMHLMQAAHYSWKLGDIEFELWYTSRADFAINGWAQKQFPKPGEKGSEFCHFNEKGEPLKTIPFIVGYQIAWNKGVLEYRRIGPRIGEWVPTIITKQGIEEYFEFVSKLTSASPLPPRPLNLSPKGEKGNYSICSYCPLQPVCDKKEGATLEAWTQDVRTWVAQLPATGSLK